MRRAAIYSSLLFSLFIGACGEQESKNMPESKGGLDSIAAVRIEPAVNDTTPPADGVFEKKHPNGQISVRGEIRNGKREGTWFSYYESGQAMSQGEYVNGIRNGKSITWYPNGQKRFEGAYTNDKQTGTWKYWEENGKLAKEENYDKPSSK